MKKLPLSFLLLLFTATVIGQTIVSTSPENKNVILEEFTGIYCGFCPQGHAIANAMINANPDDVYVINIHTGGYANPTGSDPDFRTPFGAAIAGQSNLVGYPAGTVNRHFFPGQAQNGGTGTAMGRGAWTSTGNEILGEASYVNVAVEADINIQTNEITVHVEAYYTGNSPESSNLINVALLQNNTLGPQSGGGAGNNYIHNHRLVHMITGQWGESVSPTTTGTFIDKTYTYTIPADYNGVPVELLDLEIVAFLSETHQELPTGSSCTPTFSGVTETNDANLRYVENLDLECQMTAIPHINVQNLGQDEITSLAIEYTVNSGTTETYNWSGSILTLHNETIALPELLNLDVSNTIEISLPDDNNNSNNTVSDNFDGYEEHAGGLVLTIETQSNGSEISWNVKTLSGSTLTAGGPYNDNETIVKNINLGNGCYEFNLMDSGGNGGSVVSLKDSAGTIIYETSGNYGSGESEEFGTNGIILSIGDNALNNVIIYPNPANEVLNIKNAENSDIEIYDLLGRAIVSKSNISLNEQINVSSLTTGTYIIKITNNNQVKTKKFIVNK